MQNSNEFFATAKPARLFFKVALPGLVSMLAMSLYIAIEGAFVGQMLGETAFAAINIGFPVVMINFALSDLIGVGSAVPISVSLGRGDNDRANNYFTCSLIMIFLTGILMGLTMYFSAPLFTSLMGADGTLAELAIKYIRVYAIMSPVTTVVFAADNYLRISGFVKGSMLLNVAMSLMTVAFLAVFIGIFRLDIAYSALSSCLAMFICAIVAIIPFVLKRSVLRFVRPYFKFEMIKEIVACGTPVFLNNVAGRVAVIILNAALLRMGGEMAVAAYSVLMYANGIVEPMLYGMCDSVQPAIGYNWGAKSIGRVRDITKVTFAVCGLVSSLCTVVMLVFPRELAGIFVDAGDTALMDMSVDAMKIFAFSFAISWFSFAVQGFLAAVEKPLPATVVSLCKSMIFPIILVYALEPFGLDGLWFNYVGTSLLSMIPAIILLLGVQRNIKKGLTQKDELR